MDACDSEAFLFSKSRHIAAITERLGARAIAPGLLGCVASLPGVAPASTAADVVRVERRALAMGTRVEIAVEAEGRGRVVAASEAALDAVSDAERRLSTWRDDSELVRLNSAEVGSWVPLSPVTAHELSEAVAWADATGGAFDPTVGALVRAWDLRGGGRVPGEHELRTVRRGVGHAGLEVSAGAARRIVDGVVVEEGGFGKGAALRAAMAAARAAGARCVRVDLGGQWAVSGSCEPMVLSVAHPDLRDTPIASFAWIGGSVATSGHSERTLTVHGSTVGHLLDPRTGRPAPDRGSVTVLADDPLAADAVATALAVMGPEEGLRWLRCDAPAGVEAAFAIASPDGHLRLVATEALGSVLRPADGVEVQIVDRSLAIRCSPPPAGPGAIR